MKIGKVSFSDKGFKHFEKLTRAEQKEFLKQKMPLRLKFDSLLKGVKYAKRKESHKKTTESKQKELPAKRGGKDSID